MQTLSSGAIFSGVGLTFWYTMCVAAGNFWGFLLYHQCICYLHVARFLESTSICLSLPLLRFRSAAQWSFWASLHWCFILSSLWLELHVFFFARLSWHTGAHFLAPSQERVQERWMHESSNCWNFFFIGSHTWMLVWMSTEIWVEFHFLSELWRHSHLC